MSQFDVHGNTGARRQFIPFVVVIQSRRFDAARSRVIIPMVDKRAEPPIDPELNPSFEIEGRSVVLHPLQTVSLRAEQLGEKIGSLADDGDRIIAAIDLLISRAWG
ncbi:plasmid maintenance protein CcdB [Azospirillum thiophilum]|uniref:Toxin CcdB n=1 Tax=Azospirillum thiophilum TaxID=528244 RepID=A0AAC9EYI0_9PROT|nr:CcdB family protein [Azospirillum thiophilum]ALG74799.1 plasmid maintenance protein CcdB [Azospirillum thiophilum]KJR61623.1 plasmid maintenance protein CcdB [Azospirillum thiophilum]